VIDLQPDRRLTRAQAESVLEAWLGVPVTCSDIIALKGGMVNSVFRLQFDREPHRAVIKVHGAGDDTFTAEARGLDHLRVETACPVPRVHAVDDSARLVPHAYLLLEDIPGVCRAAADLGTSERSDVEVQLASVLSELHDHTGQHWGEVRAGSADVSWADVFSARLAGARAHPELPRRLPQETLAEVDLSIDLCRAALGDAGRPTLVHGDVWDGNMMLERRHGVWRIAALLDPDLQFADVELELAYLEVFDADRRSFFDAYTDSHPLRSGYEHRRLFYWLHTALVHVALFGDQFFCDYTSRTLDQIHRH
jgi:fructosamine-3-kinase